MKYIKWSIITSLLLALPFSMANAQKWLEMWQNPEGHSFYDIQKEFNDYFATHDQGKGTGYKQFKRWEYYMEPRVGEEGKIMNPQALTFGNYMKYVQERAFDDPGARTQSLNGDWTFFGAQDWVTSPAGYLPGNGRINVIAFHPTNNNIIYIGAPAGGLWRTTDNGNSWAPLTDGIAFWGVSGIVINPNNTNNIFILTGDGDGNSSRSAGVWETTNGGTTWTPTGLFINQYTSTTQGYKLLMDPSNSNILYAVMTNGLQKSTNAGATWTNVKSGNYRDMEFRPGNSNTLYLTGGNAIHRSTNGGSTWTQVHTVASANRIALAVSPANSNYVYALAGPSAGAGAFRGLWRSTNGGTTWTLRTNTPNILGSSPTGGSSTDQAWYDLALAVSPTNINLLHSGGINTWSSADGGANWSIQTYWNRNNASYQWMHGDVHELVYQGNTLYEGNDGGISRTTNGGTNWIGTSAGLAISEFYRFGGTPQNASLYVGGTQDNGTNKVEGPIPDLTYYHVYGADGMEAAIDPTNDNIIYCESQNGGMRRSNNGGDSWTYIRPNNIGTSPWVTPYVLNPLNPKTIVAGMVDIGVHYGQGTPTSAWINLSNGALGGSTCRSIAISSLDSAYMYVTKSSTVWRTTNFGSTWTNITSGLPGGTYMYIAISPTDPLRIYVARASWSANSQVYMSTNGGNTWTNYSGTNLPTVPANCIVYQAGSDNGVYVGTDAGVYYRDDNLTDWEDFSTGLPFARVMELEINPLANRLRAATYGRSMWESDLYGLDCDDNLTLSGPLSGTQLIEANLTISSTNSLTSGADITFSAGNSITLNPGFTMASGSVLNAILDGCTSSKVHATPISGTYEPPMAAPNASTAAPANGFEISNYPNPFRTRTWLSYKLPGDAPVRVEVYDLSGKQLATLANETLQKAGTYTVSFDATDLPAGQYIARMTAGNRTFSRSLSRMK